MARTTQSRQRSPVLLLAVLALFVAAGAAAFTFLTRGDESDDAGPGAGDGALVAEVHRSPACGCCGEYEDYLRANGFTAQSKLTDDLDALKQELGIGDELASCHTMLIDGYFVEGHVPVEAIRELLERRPAIDGIALPGMPAGSPGMGGEKQGPFLVYAITGGLVEEFGRY